MTREKSIWFRPLSVEAINQFNQNTLISHLDIIVTKFSENKLYAKMNVGHKTIQPFKLLHGGASAVLAESLGSIAANLVIDPQKEMAVGMHLEISHLRSKKDGHVLGIATPLYIGRSSQTWNIKIMDENETNLISDAKLILFIKTKTADK